MGAQHAHKLHVHKRHRRAWLAVAASLAVGGMAVAASLPVSRADGAVLGVLAEAPARVATAYVVESSVQRSSVPLAPLLEGLPMSSLHSRPVVVVPVASAQTVRTASAGATAVFLGDSYTSGWNGAGLGARGWPQLISRERGWRTINLAVAGTGFINAGWTNQPVGSRVPEAIKQKPDVVFIAAGHNDSRWSSATTAEAADKVIDRLHRALPDALLVIIAPIWPSGSPPARCLELRDHLRRTAASVGAIFIDPLGEGWFAGSRQHLIGPDGIHPTDAGHRAMADRVGADLAGPG